MVKSTTQRATLLGAFGLYALSAQAQDADQSGLSVTLDVDQQLSTESNAGLTPGGESSTTAATTSFAFNLLSETPVDILNLRVGGALRVLNSPNTNGTEVDLDDPSLRFSFARDVGHSSFNVRANYSRSPVEFTRPLSDFTDADTGEIVLPEDLDDLQGDGDRISLGYSLGLELGKDAPLGLGLSASENILRYSGTNSAGLFRTERRALGANLRATISPVLEANLNLSHSTYEAENTAATDRFTDQASLGLTYTASQVLTLTGGLGYSRSETEETLLGVRGTSVEEGITVNLGALYELTNGTAELTFDSNVDQNARRNTIELARSLELPNGALSASFGLTRGDADKTHVIGNLNWQRDLPTGSLSARISRSVTINNDDEDRLSTAINLGYNYQISELSSFGVAASYSASEDTVGGNKSTRANASATYSLQVTEDWNLNSGIEFRRVDTATAAPANSNRIFLGIGRRFDLRP